MEKSVPRHVSWVKKTGRKVRSIGDNANHHQSLRKRIGSFHRCGYRVASRSVLVVDLSTARSAPELEKGSRAERDSES